MNLPIDIISVNCLNPLESLKALDYSTEILKFNNSYLFTNEKINSTKHKVININKFNSITDYSDFILGIGNYVDSEYVLIVQDDGYIINPKKWTNEFLAYDYIGAPWPGQYTWRKRWKNETYLKAYINSKKNRVGNGGFSLRSRKFLNFSSAFNSTNGIPEDVFLCLINYESAKKNGIKFPSAEIAYNFSCEVPLGGFNLSKEIKNHHLDINQHFGWHGKRVKNFEHLLKLKEN